MKPSKTSKQWMRDHINDPFVQLAQKDGYRSRAAYKLLEIDAEDIAQARHGGGGPGRDPGRLVAGRGSQRWGAAER